MSHFDFPLGHHEKRGWTWKGYTLLAVVALVVIAIGVGLYQFVVLQQDFGFGVVFDGQKAAFQQEEHAEEKMSVVSLLPTLLGMKGEKTYLVLFQNNTEMRPGGGFIGTYGVIRMSKGRPEVIVLEGVEALDDNAPDDWRVDPPAIMQRELGVDRWYFRDSNWSPDFPTNAQRALDFYHAEGGVAANDIDVVVAVTPHVLEALLGVVGDIQVDGLTFTKDSATEVLEYQVEYGFAEQGIAVERRKDIIRPFFDELSKRLVVTMLRHPKQLTHLGEELIAEKHLLAYAKDAQLQEHLIASGLSGVVDTGEHDFLLWVDANLAALKTDHAMNRELTYSIKKPLADGRIPATVSMTYTHNGVFDWRTTRYRSYARVYLPPGTYVTAGRIADNAVSFDHGEELGKQWAGTFVVIEPGQKKTVSFDILLSPAIAEDIQNRQYQLYAQKQSGMFQTQLTLHFDFDTNIRTAVPSEEQKYWGDAQYQVTRPFDTDHTITVGLE